MSVAVDEPGEDVHLGKIDNLGAGRDLAAD